MPVQFYAETEVFDEFPIQKRIHPAFVVEVFPKYFGIAPYVNRFSDMRALLS